MIATNTISLRVKLLAAVATAQSPITGHYVGMTTAGIVSTVQAIHINTNSTTAVTIVPNATAGNVNILKNLQVSNADSATISVIVEQWDGVTAKVIATVPLVINQYLTIDSDGKITVSTTGGLAGTGTVTQVQGNGTVNGLTLTGNVTTSGNLTLGGNLTGTAPALTAGNVTSLTGSTGTPSAVNLTNGVSLPLTSPTYNGAYDISGWFALGACTYETADSPTFQFSIASDVTGFIGLGNRIKLTQTTVKYFVVTGVGAFTAGKTIITVYGGTDYTLANAAITLPYFSTHKAPFGFPLNQTKWDVVVEFSTNSSNPSPTSTTWYNITSINIPIGAFNVSIEGVFRVVGTIASVSVVDTYVTLSTANNTESNKRFTDGIGYLAPIGTAQIRGSFYRDNDMVLTSKATHYLNQKTNQTGMTDIEVSGAAAIAVIKARFLYL